MKRIILIALVCISCVVLLGIGGVEIYLHSQAFKNRVARQLESLYGGPVELGGVNVGFTSSTLSGVVFHEADAGGQGFPWLSVASARINASLWRLARGDLAHADVELRGVWVALRFDQQGMPLTHLPSTASSQPMSIPNIHVKSAQVVISRAGQADWVIPQVQGQVRQVAGQVLFDGSLSSPGLGTIDCLGELDSAFTAITLNVQSIGKIELTQQQIESMPLVPADVVKQVHVDHLTADFHALLSLRFATHDFHCQATLVIADSSIFLPAAECRLHNIAGDITVHDAVMEMHGMRADLLGGEAHLDARLALGSRESKLDIERLEVQDLDTHDLPAAWNVPELVRRSIADGKLFGSAQLTVLIHSGGPFGVVEVRGEGKGQIRDPHRRAEPVDFDWSISTPETPSKPVAAGGELPLAFCCYCADYVETAATTNAAPASRAAAMVPELAVRLLETVLLQGKKLPPLPKSFDVNFKLQNIDLAELARNLELPMPLAAAGKLSLQLKATLPATSWSKLPDLSDLKAEGSLRSEHLSVLGISMDKLNAMVTVKDGVLKLTEFQGLLDGTPLYADVELKLRDQYPFSAKISWPHGNLAASKEPFKLAADSLGATALASGTLRPLHFKAAGDVNVRKLKLDTLVADKVVLRFTADENVLRLQNFEASFYGGEATGSATVPFDPQVAGNVDFTVRNLETAGIVRALKLPVRVAGRVSGTLQGTLPAARNNEPRRAVLTLDIHSPQMRVQNIPAEQLQGNVEYAGGVVEYKLQGKTLGGTFDLEGQIPTTVPAEPEKKAEAKKGRLRLTNIQIGTFLQALQMPQAESIRGRANVKLDYVHQGPGLFPTGKGTVELSSVRWHDRTISGGFFGQVEFSPELVRLIDVSGDLGNGTITARGRYVPGRPSLRDFAIDLARIDASVLLAPLSETQVSGILSGRINGTLGSECRGDANFTFGAGRLLGLEVAEWNIPLRWGYSPVSGRAQIDVYETSAQVAGGRARGKFSLAWDYGARVEGSLQLTDVDMQNVLRQAGGSELGGGRLSARVEISGNNVHSLDDLRGSVSASFKQARTMQLPVFQQIAPFFGAGSRSTFQNGGLQAQIERGSVRIQQLVLQGPTLQVFMTGAMAFSGALNLSVLAQTNTLGLPTDRLRLLGMNVPVAGPLPLMILQEASNLLSNQMVYLQVRGNIRSPIVQPQAIPLLTDEAIRYFLNRANLPASFGP